MNKILSSYSMLNCCFFFGLRLPLQANRLLVRMLIRSQRCHSLVRSGRWREKLVGDDVAGTAVHAPTWSGASSHQKDVGQSDLMARLTRSSPGRLPERTLPCCAVGVADQPAIGHPANLAVWIT
jgi:hypothetical protein